MTPDKRVFRLSMHLYEHNNYTVHTCWLCGSIMGLLPKALCKQLW